MGNKLLLASRNGDFVGVRKLVSKNPSKINAEDKNGNTPLICACFNGHRNGHRDIIERLIQAGANPDHQNDHGVTALICASENGHTSSVQTLLAAPITLNLKAENGMTALLCAAKCGAGDITRLLLKAGGHINHQDSTGSTALILAAREGHLEVVQALLQLGRSQIDLNTANQKGFTALICAAFNGYLEVVTLLLSRGADPNIQNKDGDTALLWASHKGHREVVRALLAADANPDLQNEDLNTALICACYNGHKEIMQMLLFALAAVDKQNMKGFTALMCAVFNGHEDIVQMLLAAGADLDIRDHEGSTAYDLAVEPELRSLLKSHQLQPAPSSGQWSNVNPMFSLARARNESLDWLNDSGPVDDMDSGSHGFLVHVNLDEGADRDQDSDGGRSSLTDGTGKFSRTASVRSASTWANGGPYDGHTAARPAGPDQRHSSYPPSRDGYSISGDSAVARSNGYGSRYVTNTAPLVPETVAKSVSTDDGDRGASQGLEEIYATADEDFAAVNVSQAVLPRPRARPSIPDVTLTFAEDDSGLAAELEALQRMFPDWSDTMQSDIRLLELLLDLDDDSSEGEDEGAVLFHGNSGRGSVGRGRRGSTTFSGTRVDEEQSSGSYHDDYDLNINVCIDLDGDDEADAAEPTLGSVSSWASPLTDKMLLPSPAAPAVNAVGQQSLSSFDVMDEEIAEDLRTLACIFPDWERTLSRDKLMLELLTDALDHATTPEVDHMRNGPTSRPSSVSLAGPSMGIPRRRRASIGGPHALDPSRRQLQPRTSGAREGDIAPSVSAHLFAYAATTRAGDHVSTMSKDALRAQDDGVGTVVSRRSRSRSRAGFDRATKMDSAPTSPTSRSRRPSTASISREAVTGLGAQSTGPRDDWSVGSTSTSVREAVATVAVSQEGPAAVGPRRRLSLDTQSVVGRLGGFLAPSGASSEAETSKGGLIMTGPSVGSYAINFSLPESIISRSPISGLFRGLGPPMGFRDAMTGVLLAVERGDFEGADGASLARSMDRAMAFSQNEPHIRSRSTNLSTDQLAALKMFCMDRESSDRGLRYIVNSALLHPDPRVVKPLANILWLLLHGLKQCPPCSERLVHRAVLVDEASRYRSGGGTFVWSAFTTGTTDMAGLQSCVQLQMARVPVYTLFSVQLTSGRARDVSGYVQEYCALAPGPTLTHEKVVIMPPNSRFQLVSITPMTSESRGSAYSVPASAVESVGRSQVILLKELPPVDPILLFD